VAGFNGKVRCTFSVCDEFCLSGDILIFKDGYTMRRDGDKSLYYASFKDFISENAEGNYEFITGEFSKADLKTCMRVRFSNESFGIVLLNTDDYGDVVLCGDNCVYLKYFDENMTNVSKPNLYIVDIYDIPGDLFYLTDLKFYGKLLWKRPEPRNFTKYESEYG
jgi:hypothetical protein